MVTECSAYRQVDETFELIRWFLSRSRQHRRGVNSFLLLFEQIKITFCEWDISLFLIILSNTDFFTSVFCRFASSHLRRQNAELLAHVFNENNFFAINSNQRASNICLRSPAGYWISQLLIRMQNSASIMNAKFRATAGGARSKGFGVAPAIRSLLSSHLIATPFR